MSVKVIDDIPDPNELLILLALIITIIILYMT